MPPERGERGGALTEVDRGDAGGRDGEGGGRRLREPRGALMRAGRFGEGGLGGEGGGGAAGVNPEAKSNSEQLRQAKHCTANVEAVSAPHQPAKGGWAKTPVRCSFAQSHVRHGVSSR